MTLSKKLLALLLGALMILSLAGCLEDKPETADGAGAPEATDQAGDAPVLDPDLPAFTLGDETVTVGDVQAEFDYFKEYMAYMGYSGSVEENAQYLDMIIEGLLQEKVIPWKAKELGVTLTPEKLAEVEQSVEEMMADYASDYLEDARTELGETASPEAIAARARELLADEMETYYGVPFEELLKTVRESYETEALTALLQEQVGKTVSVTEEDAKAWFAEELASQKERFDQDYAAFKDQELAYRLGDTEIPALYTPEGFGRMRLITFDPDQEDSTTYAANELELTALETEYGRLVLRGENEDRQKEILDRYEALQAMNEDFVTANREKAEKARADALNGVSFTDIFNTYSKQSGPMGYYGYAEGEPLRDGTVIFYTKEQDTEFLQEVWETAVALEPGQVGEILQIGDTFYLIERLEDLPAGEAVFEDNASVYTEAARVACQGEEWDAIQEDWLHEARNAATFFEENYASLAQ